MKKIKIPNFVQWSMLFNVMKKKERMVFISLFLVFLLSGIFLQISWLQSGTELQPKEYGTLKEGLLGQPRLISPIYLSDNDNDKDIVELLYRGLLKYDKNGEIVSDMAEMEIEEEGRVYKMTLGDYTWHDGIPINADDIIFTINIIQSPQYKSALRSEWLSIVVEKLDEKTINFRLEKPYFSFPETIARTKIIPRHIFQDISPEALPWVINSKEYLIGSGMYKVSKIDEEEGFIKEIKLEINKDSEYNPYISNIVFKFYKTQDELLRATKNGDVNALAIQDPLYIKELENIGFNLNSVSLPRYFALFFNIKNNNKDVNEALSYGINKNRILEEIFKGAGQIAHSPLLPSYFGLEEVTQEYNISKSIEILNELGYEMNENRLMAKKVSSEKLFTNDLIKGDEGEEVQSLQECLAKFSDIYPDGSVSGYFGNQTKAAVIKFQEKYKERILEPIGLSSGTGKVGGMTIDILNEVCAPDTGEREILEINITTHDAFPLIDIAESIKKDLLEIGITTNITSLSLSEFQTKVLTERDFDMLLFGEALGKLADPFTFWHSSQIDYPGVNVSGYQSNSVDNLLEEIRETSSEEERKTKMEEIQNIIISDNPAIFLIQPDYFYFTKDKIRGFDVKQMTEGCKRFSNIEEIYLRTKRVWK